MTRREKAVALSVSALCCVVVVAFFAASATQPKPEIACKIRDALPLLRDVREFLRDPQAPADVRGFKAQMAWQEDWTSRRDDVAAKIDALITECERDLAEMRGD